MAQEWQPIETAPRDGTIVWVAAAHSACVAYWYGRDHKTWRNWFKGCRYENAEIGGDAFAPEPIWFEPTHWQPTPTPPQEDK